MKPWILLLLLSIETAAIPSWLPQKTNTDLGGYVKELPYLIFAGDATGFNNLIHFRADLNWYPWNSLTFELGGRLQLYTGDSFRLGRGSLNEIYSEDAGYADLSGAWTSLLYANMDRAWAGLELGSLNMMLGRQRINWGTNLVWNPNDWYNAYNLKRTILL